MLLLILTLPVPSWADDLEAELGAATSTMSSATDECLAAPVETALDSKLGSVGFMKNIAEHPESIRAIAKQLLTEALASKTLAEEPQCMKNCVGKPEPRVIYRVEPTVFIAEKDQQALCLSLEESTAKKPLQFKSKRFESLNKLNDWMMEFSQGRGDDGKLLYEQCGGNCSPRYTFHIRQVDKTLMLDADVLCGLARDKKSDDYLVSTTAAWQCPAP